MNNDSEVLNYDIQRRVLLVAHQSSLLFKNRITDQLDNLVILTKEISTCFSWNSRWYLILSKYGDELELYDFKREKRRCVNFIKMNLNPDKYTAGDYKLEN